MELDRDDNALAYYGVCDGADILMNEIDVKTQKLEAERLAKQHADLVQQQEREMTAMQELKRQNKRGS